MKRITATNMRHMNALETCQTCGAQQCPSQIESGQCFYCIANQLKYKLDESNRKLTTIYNLVEGDADGTVDSTPYEKLCNEIVGIIKP